MNPTPPSPGPGSRSADRLAGLVLLEIVALAYFGVALLFTGAPGAAIPGEATPAAHTPDRTQPGHEGGAPSAVANVRPIANAPERTSGVHTAPRRPSATIKWNKDDPVGVLLTGSVRWRDGGPVLEPMVRVRRGGLGPSASTSAGCYAVAEVSPGTWTVTVRALGAVWVEETIEITDTAEQRRDFVLDRAYPVRVFCTAPDGKDLAKALAEEGVDFANFYAIGQRDPFPDRFAPTRFGNVRADDAGWDEAGVLFLASPPPAHAALMLQHVVIQQQRIEAGQKEVRFVVDPADWKAKLGTVTLRVVDADSRAPLADAFVSLDPRFGRAEPCDAEGRVTLTNARPGFLVLGVYAEGHEYGLSTLRIEPGRTLDLGDVALGGVVELSGRVEDQNGEPPEAATISWTELKWRMMPTAFGTYRTARVEADGTFRLNVGAGKIALQARTREDDVAFVVIDYPPTSPVVLRLVRAAKLHVVRNADPTRTFTITFFDSQRQPVESHTIGSDEPQWTVTMPPATFAYEVNDEADRLVQSGSVTLGARPTTVEIR